MTSFRDAVARLELPGGTRGTGFIAGPGLLLTALHCLVDRGTGQLAAGPLRLTFRHRQIDVPLSDLMAHDPAGDWALLSFPPAAGDPEPIPFAPLGEEQVTAVVFLPWQSRGYPDSNPGDGKDCGGLVRTTQGLVGGAGAIQLFSFEAAGGLGEPVAGYSGAPVLVNGVAVGILRAAEGYQQSGQPVRSEAGTLYACPIQVVLLKVGNRLPPPRTDDALPPLPAGLPLPEKPFRYLSHYKREDARVYFGRTREVRELHALVTAADTPPVVLVYGQAGVGKSSVLAAGLGPRLEVTHRPRYERRRRTLAETLRAVLGAPADLDVGALRAAWVGLEGQPQRPLVVMLDQVEEALVQGGGKSEISHFIQEIAAVFGPGQGPPPKGRLLLGFRKEWAADIRQMLADHGVPYRPFLLEPMERDGVLDVVRGLGSDASLAAHYALTVDDDAAEAIANELLRDTDAPIAPTLQVLLTQLWEKAKVESLDHPRFSKALFEKIEASGYHLHDFLRRKLDAVGENGFKRQVESGLVHDVLLAHTTEAATAADRTATWLEGQYGKRAVLVAELVVELKKEPCVLVDGDNDPEGKPTTRLVHDALAPVVLKEFRTSNRAGQQARRRLEYRTVDWASGKDGPTLDARDLGIVMEGLAAMREPTDDERRVVEESEKRRQQEASERRAAAEESEKRRQQEASERRAAAEARTRRRWGNAAAGVVGLALVVGLAKLGYDRVQADQKKIGDERNRRIALAAEIYDRAQRSAGFMALHLVTRAAIEAPEDDPRLDIYLARAAHVASAAPIEVTHLQGLDEPLMQARIDAGQTAVLGVTESHRLAAWKLPEGTRLASPVDGLPLHGYASDNAFAASVAVNFSPAFSGDGSRALAIVDVDGDGGSTAHIRGWTVDTGSGIFDLPAESIINPRFSPTGLSLLDAHQRCSHVVWPGASQEERCKKNEEGEIIAMSASSARNWALVARSDEAPETTRFELVNPDTGSHLADLPAIHLRLKNFHAGGAVASSPNGRFVGIVDENDQRLSVFDVVARPPVRVGEATAIEDGVIFDVTDDGELALTAAKPLPDSVSLVRVGKSTARVSKHPMRPIRRFMLAVTERGIVISSEFENSVWDASSLDPWYVENTSRFGGVLTSTLSAAGRIVAVTKNRQALTWIAPRAPYAEPVRLKGPGPLTGAAFVLGGDAIVALSRDGFLYSCQQSGACVRRGRPAAPPTTAQPGGAPGTTTLLRVAPDGRAATVTYASPVGSEAKCRLELWGKDLGEVKASHDFEANSFQEISLGTDGRSAGVVFVHHDVHAKSLADPKCLVRLTAAGAVETVTLSSDRVRLSADGQVLFENLGESVAVSRAIEANSSAFVRLSPPQDTPVSLLFGLLTQAAHIEVQKDRVSAVFAGGAHLEIPAGVAGATAKLERHELHTLKPGATAAERLSDIHVFAVSPQGRWILGVPAGHRTGAIFEASTGLALTEDIQSPAQIVAAAFVGDDTDQRLVTVCADGVLRSWYVATRREKKPAWLEHLAAGISGERLKNDNGDDLEPLPHEDARKARKKLLDALEAAAAKDPAAKILLERFRP